LASAKLGLLARKVTDVAQFGLGAMRLRSLAVLLAVSCVTISACSKTEPVRQLPPADRVVVRKAERQLLLMRGGKVERSYPVALGLNPVGPKERSGDSRMPEGTFRLEHNPHSDYFLSIKVSYPNEVDVERARAHQWDPGGDIMIHGLPNVLKYKPEYYADRDWTDGRIALSNADMAEIWRLTADGIPIDILP
jgi:murein L,D-transpeptidase YafK